jgi:CheY-like chemotaxis protein
MGEQLISLVVDDEAAVRSLVTSTLTRDGFRTLEAEDGIEALSLVRGLGNRISIIVSDIRMPKMDGHAFAKAVRSEFPSIPFRRFVTSSGRRIPTGN